MRRRHDEHRAILPSEMSRWRYTETSVLSRIVCLCVFSDEVRCYRCLLEDNNIAIHLSGYSNHMARAAIAIWRFRCACGIIDLPTVPGDYLLALPWFSGDVGSRC
jgi:hypothetical protein